MSSGTERPDEERPADRRTEPRQQPQQPQRPQPPAMPPQSGSSPAVDSPEHIEDALDEALAESFPASDPVSIVEDRERRAKNESGR